MNNLRTFGVFFFYFWLFVSILFFLFHKSLFQEGSATGNPGSVIVPQHGSSKITVFVRGKNTILKFVGNTKYKSMKLTLQLVVVVRLLSLLLQQSFPIICSNSLYIQLSIYTLSDLGNSSNLIG